MRRLHDLQARVRDADAFGVDAGLAALFAAAAVADCLATSTDVGQDRALSALLGAIIFVPLMWRRRAPLLVAVAFAALSLAQIPLETLYPETVAPRSPTSPACSPSWG